jgi:hypothetical protein
MVLPTSASMSGITVARVWPSYGLPGSAFTWVTNWPPLQCLRVVATVTLTPNS